MMFAQVDTFSLEFRLTCENAHEINFDPVVSTMVVINSNVNTGRVRAAAAPMIGRDTAQLSLGYGVDDIDGTIDDTTKIYSMAGSEEQNPAMSTPELIDLIKRAGRKPIERDTIYNVIHDYSVEEFEVV